MVRPSSRIYYLVFIRWILLGNSTADGDPNIVYSPVNIHAAVVKAREEAVARIGKDASWGSTDFKIVVATVAEVEVD